MLRRLRFLAFHVPGAGLRSLAAECARCRPAHPSREGSRRIGRNSPDPRLSPLRKPHGRQMIQPADDGRPLGESCITRRAAHIDEAFRQLLSNGGIDTGPALLGHLPGQGCLDFSLVLGPSHSVASSLARARIPWMMYSRAMMRSLPFWALPPKDDVAMGMPGIPMIDGDPLEPGTQVLLHLRRQIPRVGFEILSSLRLRLRR